jgi:small-conductance mechanosensitive channel
MPADSAAIRDRIDRLEEIAEELEAGEIDVATAKELREEADEHLRTLRQQLDAGDGELVEIEARE